MSKWEKINITCFPVSQIYTSKTVQVSTNIKTSFLKPRPRCYFFLQSLFFCALYFGVHSSSQGVNVDRRFQSVVKVPAFFFCIGRTFLEPFMTRTKKIAILRIHFLKIVEKILPEDRNVQEKWNQISINELYSLLQLLLFNNTYFGHLTLRWSWVVSIFPQRHADWVIVSDLEFTEFSSKVLFTLGSVYYYHCYIVPIH